MLSEKELADASVQLSKFREAHDSQHITLSDLLEKYNNLISEYNRLRSDLEEERDSRERYKQMARGSERNPFVLVLVDGDGYVFEEDLVSNGAEGGERAARLLDRVVKDSLRNRGLEDCRIMVRIYANLVGLSKALSRAKLAGPEKRSLAPFTANFTRSNELFDFVDAGELKENADFKIRAMFRQFVDNPQCRHIFFAGCHDVGYINDLQPYAGNRDRITLVRGAGFHPQFQKLNLRIEDFPNVFRLTSLEGATLTLPTRSAPPATNTAPAPQDDAPVCAFFQKNLCKYGKNCKFLHVKTSTNGSSPARDASESKNWRQNASAEKPPTFGMSSLAKSDNDFMSGHSDAVQDQLDFATALPPKSDIPSDMIPVNNKKHRLDPYINPPTNEHRAAYRARIDVQKLCNNMQFNGFCPNGDACEFDHRPASPAILNCLREVATKTPCPKGGNCRSLTCFMGHICQRADCKYRGGSAWCKFPVPVHLQDLHVANYEHGIMGKRNEDLESVSGRGASSPGEGYGLWSPRSTSDGEGATVMGLGLGEDGDDASLD